MIAIHSKVTKPIVSNVKFRAKNELTSSTPFYRVPMGVHIEKAHYHKPAYSKALPHLLNKQIQLSDFRIA